jgi:hypothetical protein
MLKNSVLNERDKLEEFMFQITSKLTSIADIAIENNVKANFNDWAKEAITKLSPHVLDATLIWFPKITPNNRTQISKVGDGGLSDFHINQIQKF